MKNLASQIGSAFYTLPSRIFGSVPKVNPSESQSPSSNIKSNLESKFDSFTSSLNDLTNNSNNSNLNNGSTKNNEHSKDDLGGINFTSNLLNEIRNSIGRNVIMPLASCFSFGGSFKDIKIGDCIKDCFTSLKNSLPNNVNKAASKAVDTAETVYNHSLGFYETFKTFISNLMEFAKSILENLTTITNFLGVNKNNIEVQQQNNIDGSSMAR